MSWLPGAAGDRDLEAVLALRPDVRDAFSDLYEHLWQTSDPQLLELCRLRMAQLLRCEVELRVREEWADLAEAKVLALATYPSSPLFTARERACLAYTERVCGDPGGLTDDEVAAVRQHLSEAQLVALTTALTVFEGFQRALLLLGVTGTPERRRGLRAAT